MLKRSLVAATALVTVIALGAGAPAASAVEATGTSATPSPAPTDTAQPDVRRVGTVPAWVRIDNATLDWKWLKAGWEIRFSQRETASIAANVGACSALLSAFSHPALRVLAMGCGILSWYAARLVVQGRCLNAFVPLRLIGGFSVGSRTC